MKLAAETADAAQPLDARGLAQRSCAGLNAKRDTQATWTFCARAMAIADDRRPSAWIMWMPAGVHTITPTRGDGRPVTVRVQIDRGTAAVLQQSLERHLSASRQRPYFDFNHADAEAAAWPNAFEWRDAPEPGVWVHVEWTDAGQSAVSGRMYRAFSPSFYVDNEKANPARIVGAPLNMGGLVNDPAFAAIAPMWARRFAPETAIERRAGPADYPAVRLGGQPGLRSIAASAKTNRSPMNKTQKLKALFAALGALRTERVSLAAKADNAEALKAKDNEIDAQLKEIESLEASADQAISDEGRPLTVEVLDARAALDAKDRELQEEREKREALEAKARERAKLDAKAAVDMAVQRGAIPAQNTEMQEQWRGMIERDPSAATLLANLHGPVAMHGRMTGGRSDAGDVQVTQADLVRSLEAYGQEEDAVLRGRIWRADIRPRVEKDSLDLVDPVRAIQAKLKQGKYALSAVNSLGTLTGTLVVQRSLDFLKLTFPMLSRVSTDFSDQPVKFNQTVQTRLISELALQSFVAADGYQDGSATTTDVPVVIDQHKYVQVKFGVEELASTMRGLFDEQTQPMHYALGKGMCDALYGLMLAANYTEAPTISSIANFSRKTLTKVDNAMSSRGVPEIGRSILLNGDAFESLANDQTIVTLAAYQRPEIITRGTLPEVAGFQPIRAYNFPAAVVAQNLIAFAFRPDAWALATRPPSDYTTALAGVPATGVVQMVTNADTGITVMLVQFIDHLAGAARGRVAIMFGVAKGQVKSGQRVVTS